MSINKTKASGKSGFVRISVKMNKTKAGRKNG